MILDTQEEILSFVVGVLFTSFMVVILSYLDLIHILCIISMLVAVYKQIFSTSFITALTSPIRNSKAIQEIPAVAGYQSDTKFEGWMNEYPETYDPQTYQISETESVYVQLQGHLLTVNHVRGDIPKHSMWNEQKLQLDILHHRIYNLLDAKIMLLPEGLTKRSYWNKKYPICIVLYQDQTELNLTKSNVSNKEEKISMKNTPPYSSSRTAKKRISIFKKKLPESPHILITKKKQVEEEANEELNIISRKYFLERDIMDDRESIADWTILNESMHQTRLYLFACTNREKEEWFRRLAIATHREAYTVEDPDNSDLNLKESISKTLVNVKRNESEYLKCMAQFDKIQMNTNRLWVNMLLGRIFFNCTRDESTTKSLVKDRIQRKLNAIKFPNFIEQLLIMKLSLGNSLPIIHKANKPKLDQRGLWIDLDISYDGTIGLDLLIKLNLLRYKEATINETAALEDTNFSAEWLDSDVDDTPDGTDDEDHIFASNKLVTLVDKIVESKFFQGATKNRYIKKVVEGVSNTELGLKVEIKDLVGTLVLNIPPPPSDRLWFGFRPTERLHLSAQPIVGERNFEFLRKLTTLIIKKKLDEEFQKVLLPNMENVLISLMSQNLPE